MVSLLCSARSGSTSLTYYLSELLNLEQIISPKLNSMVDLTSLKKDIFYKIMIYNKPKEINSMFEFGTEVIKISDKVILLDRENKREQGESLAFKKKKYKTASSGMYHTKEFYKNIDENLVNEFMNRAIRQGNSLKELSNHHKIPLFTYESIYYGNGLNDILEYLNVESDLNLEKKYIDNKNKQRLFYTKERLL